MDNPKQERRNEPRRRRRALKRARITFKGRWATIDCTVLNLSDLGACLKVESPIGNLAIARPQHRVVDIPAYRSPKQY